MLERRQHIGECLAGMLFVGQGVDHVHLQRRPRDGLDLLLREGSNHQRMHPALEIARDVLHRFACSAGEFGRNVERTGAELADRDLERRSRAQ
jgi:hypothetical protein